jgi:hypothetical protein
MCSKKKANEDDRMCDRAASGFYDSAKNLPT